MSVQPRILWPIGDLHVGSNYAVQPDPFIRGEDGTEIRPNPFRRGLLDAFNHLTQKTLDHIGGDPFVLLLQGDMVEGCHHGTKEVVSPDEADHVNNAIALLMPIVKLADKVLVVRGTEVHTRRHEEHMADEFGAVTHPETGNRWGDHWKFSVAGCPVNAAHHMPTTSRVYLEAGPLSIQLGNERLNALDAGHTPPKVVIRSHRHRPGWYENGSAAMMVTYAWQGLTRYGHKVVPGASLKIGTQLLDWRNRDDGELPQYYDWKLPSAPEARLNL